MRPPRKTSEYYHPVTADAVDKDIYRHHHGQRHETLTHNAQQQFEIVIYIERFLQQLLNVFTW